MLPAKPGNARKKHVLILPPITMMKNPKKLKKKKPKPRACIKKIVPYPDWGLLKIPKIQKNWKTSSKLSLPPRKLFELNTVMILAQNPKRNLSYSSLPSMRSLAQKYWLQQYVGLVATWKTALMRICGRSSIYWAEEREFSSFRPQDFEWNGSMGRQMMLMDTDVIQTQKEGRNPLFNPFCVCLNGWCRPW